MGIAGVVSLAAVAMLATACDVGHQDDQVVAGPKVHVVAANVGMLDGGMVYPADGIIRVTFDRNLLPFTVNRQAVVIQDTMSPPNTFTPHVSYDPVARIVSLAPESGPCWATAGQYYSLILPIPTSANAGGLRAIDTATLDVAGNIGFQALATATTDPCGRPLGSGSDGGAGGGAVTDAGEGGTPLGTPNTNFCADVFPIFQSKCTGSYCHSGPAPIMGKVNNPQFPNQTETAPAAGLVLSDPISFAATAIGKPANGANTGPNATFQDPSAKFGINMPIVDPAGDPANSWLMYKLLLANPSTVPDPSVDVTCGGGVSTIPPFINTEPSVGPMSASERAILSNFITGREMPYPAYPALGDPAADAANGGNPDLTFDELERVRAWLTNPVVPSSCPVCSQEEDAGADASPSEAGSDSGKVAPSEAGSEAGEDATVGEAGSEGGSEAGSADAGIDATMRDAKGD